MVLRSAKRWAEGLSCSSCRRHLASITNNFSSSCGLNFEYLDIHFKNQNIGPINRVQRVGVQAIVGILLTVAIYVAEGEVYIVTVRYRFWRWTVKIWTDLYILPETNLLRRSTDRIRKFRRYYCLPLYQVTDILKNIEIKSLETINLFILVLWKIRI